MTYETLAYVIKLGGTLTFFSIFLVALTYAFWPSNRSKFHTAASMPLNSQDKPAE